MAFGYLLERSAIYLRLPQAQPSERWTSKVRYDHDARLLISKPLSRPHAFRHKPSPSWSLFPRRDPFPVFYQPAHSDLLVPSAVTSELFGSHVVEPPRICVTNPVVLSMAVDGFSVQGMLVLDFISFFLFLHYLRNGHCVSGVWAGWSRGSEEGWIYFLHVDTISFNFSANQVVWS